jgi:hypothetical protein
MAAGLIVLEVIVVGVGGHGTFGAGVSSLAAAQATTARLTPEMKQNLAIYFAIAADNTPKPSVSSCRLAKTPDPCVTCQSQCRQERLTLGHINAGHRRYAHVHACRDFL